MSQSYEEVQEGTLQLSAEERSRLAEVLLDSILTDQERAIEQEWLEVAERRRAEVDAGPATLCSRASRSTRPSMGIPLPIRRSRRRCACCCERGGRGTSSKSGRTSGTP